MTPEIAVASMFRDSQTWHGRSIDQVDRFFRQLTSQEGVDISEFGYFLVEGNSTDTTWESLCDHAYWNAPRVKLHRHEVSGSEVASVVSEQRFANLSAVANTALRAARDSGAKYVLWVESDFIVPPDLLSKLLNATRSDQWGDCLGVAPVPVFYNGGRKWFYDTWGFEGQYGRRWGNNELAELVGGSKQYLQLKSFGSCALLNGEALRAHNLDFGTGCFPALCEAGRRAGLFLACDKTVEILHPSEAYVAGRLV
jgi:cellulose synthase/poly-beta-1,6-N-acetylglucosamine synthase-like glycosyltransferase